MAMGKAAYTGAGPVRAGLAAGLAVLLALLLAPADWTETQRERAVDAALRLSLPMRPEARPDRIVLVDIDAASLQSIGPWPWRRETIAALLNTVTAGKPSAIGLDIVLAGADTRSPAALARRLAEETGRDDLRNLGETLVDGDKALANALEGQRVALGWVLDPRGGDLPQKAPILMRDSPQIGQLWSSLGASAPTEMLAAAAAGSGASSLPGDADGVVRRVPLLVAVRGALHPGLAPEVLRLASDATGYILSGSPTKMQIGDVVIPFPADGLLRLVPGSGGGDFLTISAAALLNGRADSKRLTGAKVLIGGSAPELGGLRPSIIDPLTPSSTIQAHALRQLGAGIVPMRPRFAGLLEIAGAILLIGLAIWLAQRLRPALAVAVFLAVAATVLAGVVLLASRDVLIAPLLPLLAGGAAFSTTLTSAFSLARRSEARLRRRFEQHLAPGVVDRIVADPTSLRLSGERRVITALFTDIEGFTTTSRDTDPESLIAVLDGYFEGVSNIVTAHGGMVDKFVGDAVHAFFNMPLDLANHSGKAVACAQEIHAWTERFRCEAGPKNIGFGRTRIGIESGSAVVGDVGLATKLDYTAHGSAVNLAARLEALNKETGTAILIGPAAAAAADMELTSMGVREIRGFGMLEVFTVATAP